MPEFLIDVLKPMMIVVPLGALYAATTLLYQWFNRKNKKKYSNYNN